MRDQIPATKALLVELGGWFDHLATAELDAVGGQRSVFVAPRLAAVTGTSGRELLRLGGARYVLEDLGAAPTTAAVPDRIGERLRGSFAVRFRGSREALTDADRRSVISAVWRAHPAPRVALRRPHHDLFVYVTDDGLRFGELIGGCAPELRATAVRRPFFRSYETPPRKARVLVNLSGAQPGDRFLDPCCGTGALVIEAARIGCDAFGSDVEIRAARGSSSNASFDGVNAAFVAADAGWLHLRGGRVHRAASDLPYGRSATRRGRSGTDVFARVLAGLASAVEVGGQAVLVSADDGHVGAAAAHAHDGWELRSHVVEDARTVRRSITTWRRV